LSTSGAPAAPVRTICIVAVTRVASGSRLKSSAIFDAVIGRAIILKANGARLFGTHDAFLGGGWGVRYSGGMWREKPNT
jgi:hypothetical protein